jgi:hypothetical protein
MESYSHQGKTDISSIAQRLRTDTSVHTLDLSHNELTDDSVLELASLLCVNNHLTALNLSYNHVTDVGLEYLRKAIVHKTALQVLHVGGNLNCSARLIPTFLDTKLRHLLYTGTFIWEVDDNLQSRWPQNTPFDELVYQCAPAVPPGCFLFLQPVSWRRCCEAAYRTCEGYAFWPFFRRTVPPRGGFLDWQHTDEKYDQWFRVHETLSLSLAHHDFSPEQYEELLGILQRIARGGWDAYSRDSKRSCPQASFSDSGRETCNNVE